MVSGAQAGDGVRKGSGVGVRLGDLDQRDLARLRTELVEIIAARFAYPPYYDFRAGAARVRPIGATRRQEIVGFVQAIILEPLARLEIEAPEVRRFLEQIFARFIELNPDLAHAPARRRLSAMRAGIPRAAAEVQRGLVACASGAPGNFGMPRPARSWSGSAQTNVHRVLDWAQIEQRTPLLETALGARGAASLAASEVHGPVASTPRPAAAHAGSRVGSPAFAEPDVWSARPADSPADDALPPWLAAVTDPTLVTALPLSRHPEPEPTFSAGLSGSSAPGEASPTALDEVWGTTHQPTDAHAALASEETAPLPAHLLQLNRSLFAGLESGSQSGIFGLDVGQGFSDQPTGPQPSVGLDGAPSAPGAIPPDLIAMYSAYLRDLRPGAAARDDAPGPGAAERTRAAESEPVWARGAVVSARPPAAARTSMQAGTGADQLGTADRLIFAQLRQQLEAYLRQTAHRAGVHVRGQDGAAALGALRAAGTLDEADLRLAESILALCERVIAGNPATTEDYRQALMLYLLYHRRHVGS